MSSQEPVSSPAGQAPLPPHTTRKGKKRKLDETPQPVPLPESATDTRNLPQVYFKTEEDTFQSQASPRRTFPSKTKQHRGVEAVEKLEIQYLVERLQYVLDREGRHQHSPEYIRQFQLWTSHVRDGFALVERAADRLLDSLEADDRFDEDGLFQNGAEERPAKRQRVQNQDQQLAALLQD
ncbi:hypothetical protein KCV07_g3775, partial [Aureobasidium melanogenum]